jgi:hypothetical protein
MKSQITSWNEVLQNKSWEVSTEAIKQLPTNNELKKMDKEELKKYITALLDFLEWEFDPERVDLINQIQRSAWIEFCTRL